METLWQDVRYGVRQMLRSPGFTAVAVLTLALGIGATTAIFSVANAVILDPFPYAHSERLVIVGQKYLQRDLAQLTLSPAEALDLLTQETAAFEAMAAFQVVHFTLGGDGPQMIQGTRVTSGMFPLTGVSPQLGRVITPQDDQPGGTPVVVLGHALWQRLFAADQAVLGRTLILDQQPYAVVGVMPPRFRLGGGELWVPLGLDPAETDRSRRRVLLLARLRPDTDTSKAAASLQPVAHQWERNYGAIQPEYVGMRFSVEPLLDVVLKDFRQATLLLLAAAVLLLLLACANVAHLLLARAISRRRELAVRLSLGAGLSRVARQLFTVSLLLGLVGGALGVLLALWGVEVVAALIPADYIPAETQIRINTPILGFALGVPLLALALTGAYAVLSFGVSQRVREIGIRLALGAQPGQVVREVLWRGLSWVLTGLGIGLLGTVFFGRLLSGLLFGVAPTHPGVLGGTCAAMFLVSAVACWIPARRASRVDPMVALRYE